jgi:hypothetical protein
MNDTNIKKNVLIFGVGHAVIFLGLMAILAHYFYPGTGSLENWIAQKIFHGEIPYHDFISEYPPLALMGFLLPGLFFHTTTAYSWAFAAELLMFDLLVLYLLADLAVFFKVSIKNTLAVYTLVILAIGPILVCRYDIMPAALTLLALWAFIKGKNKLAWGATALGFLAKLYPVIILPLFLLYQWKNRQYGRMFQGIAVFVIVVLIFCLPWLIIDAPGFTKSFTYHLDRPLHAESTYGSALMVGQVFGMDKIPADLTYGSWNLLSSLADKLAKIAFYVTAFFSIIIYWLFVTRTRYDEVNDSSKPLNTSSASILAQCVILLTFVFLLLNKVFSAQYLAWLCPLLPLFFYGKRKYTVLSLFVIAAAVTQYVFPYNYVSFEQVHAVPVLLLAARNLMLITAGILVAFPARYQTPGISALRSDG